MVRRRGSGASRRGLRVWRGIGARNAAADDAIVLAICPIWPGETIRWIRMDVKSVCVVTVAGENNIVHPEINYRGIVVPAGDISVAGIGSSASTLLSDTALTANFDTIFEYFVRNPEAAVDQHYGGDVDLETTADEAMQGWANTGFATKRGLVDNWFRREVFMRRVGEEADGVRSVYYDSFNTGVKKRLRRRDGSFLMFGVVRYEHTADTNFNWESIQAATIPGASHSLGAQIWNPELVEKMIEQYPQPTDTAGPALPVGSTALAQTMLGDNYVEADKITGETAQTFVKIQVGIATPIRAAVLGTA